METASDLRPVAPRPPKNRATVLVVDDEPDVVKSLQDLLRYDFRVLGATRAAEALRLLDTAPVSVVVSDQRMPEMTGVEFLHRCAETHPDVVRLLLTGYADIRAVIAAINEGRVYRYIAKPWEPEEMLAAIRDAVERHDLIAERDRLVRELEEKNRALAVANDSLRQIDQLRSAFVQVASHELRSPLTILLGLARLATATTPQGDPARDRFGRILSAAERLQNLVNQLIMMLAAQRYDLTGERGAVEVATLLREAADDVRPFVERRSQVLTVDVPEGLGAVVADRARVRDALDHLLMNAVKFTPDGGSITLGARREGGSVAIRVTDTGTGIDARDLPRVFDPFFTQFDVSHHSSGQWEFGRRGLGIGLSVVKAIAEAHGGRVSVESAPDRGSTFTLVLPAEAAAGGAPGGPPGGSA